MRWLPLLLAAACGAPEPPPAAPRSPAAIEPLDDEQAKALVATFFAAFDARDPAALGPVTTDAFVLYEHGGAVDKRSMMEWTRREQPIQRSCENEALRRSAAAIVHTSECTEVTPAKGDEPPREMKGWNAVVLVPEAGTWKVALWSFTLGGLEAERSLWNRRYREGRDFIKEHNQFLEKTVDGLSPGNALVLAMGQGRNALFLARQGWRVTGVDLADEGIRQARTAAAEEGLELEAVLADIDEYNFGTARWDLVTMLYAGASTEWMERIKTALRPGGIFVLEFFERPPGATDQLGVSRQELARAFAGWEIVTDETVEDIADWGKRKTELVRFAARKPR